MSDAQKHSLSLVFPCDNDKGTIAALVWDAKKVAEKLADDVEIIVVDNASTDGTREALLDLKLKNEIPQFTLLLHEKKLRYGQLLKSGLEAASKDLIFYTDGDAQYDVRELPLLWERLTDAVDIVNGYKTRRRDPVHRIVIGFVYQYVARFAFALPIRDIDCDFRLLRRRVLDAVELTSATGTVTIELIKKSEQAGFHFAEAPVSHLYRMHGPSKFFSFSRIVRAVGRLTALWLELMVLARFRPTRAHYQI
ncbi:MAG: glycosyltransferase family 2 protein [Patescibacteria group bacterium]